MNVFGTFDMGAPYQFHKEFTVEKCKGLDQMKNFITDYNQFSDNLMSWSKFEQISNLVNTKNKTRFFLVRYFKYFLFIVISLHGS